MMRPWTKKRAPLAKFGKDQQGATAIEYGLIGAGISIAILAAVFSIGNELSGLFESVAAVFETERCVEVGSSCASGSACSRTRSRP